MKYVSKNYSEQRKQFRLKLIADKKCKGCGKGLDFESQNLPSIANINKRKWCPDCRKLTKKASRPRQEKRIDSYGYVWLYIGDRKVREHVHKAELVLGRRLNRNEDVHHINGDKQDNRN